MKIIMTIKLDISFVRINWLPRLLILISFSSSAAEWNQNYKIVFQKYEDKKAEREWEVWDLYCDARDFPRKKGKTETIEHCRLTRTQLFCSGGLAVKGLSSDFRTGEKSSELVPKSLGPNHAEFTLKFYRPELQCHLSKSGQFSPTEGGCHGSISDGEGVYLTELRKVNIAVLPISCVEKGLIAF